MFMNADPLVPKGKYGPGLYAYGHINDVRVGDVLLHHGEDQTVSVNNIKRGGFMGTSVFGECYMSGHKPVIQRLFHLYRAGKFLGFVTGNGL